MQTDGQVISKSAGDNTGSVPSGGVLLFSTHDALPTTGCVGAGCYGPIKINGGGGGTPTLALLPMQDGDYKGMVIFVDREDAVREVSSTLT